MIGALITEGPGYGNDKCYRKGEGIGMVDWDLALRIFTFGLLAVFCSLGILIAAIYGFGKVFRAVEKD